MVGREVSRFDKSIAEFAVLATEEQEYQVSREQISRDVRV
jgi:hypothetical protein